MKIYLGIDVGSVSTNVVAIDDKYKIIDTVYIRTHGNPLKSVQEAFQLIEKKLDKKANISGVGVTGSARYLISVMVNADLTKNEITAHAIAAMHFYPDTRTIFEIGGQDSKIILLENGVVTDFAMNNVCAAGTGSFLDQQASRLGVPIEEFGSKALKSTTEVRIAGRCTVFAESDMIHKQQLGYTNDDIINGLCEALVRNYFSTVGKGKDIKEPILFQGGVAANAGIVKAFNKFLNKDVKIPEHFGVMGAIGSAILVKEFMDKNPNIKTKFKGFALKDFIFKTTSFTCKFCSNNCEVVEFWQDNNKIALFGDKCGRYSSQLPKAQSKASTE
jgi:predicted CoA-substrate-specific enzyme activase